jgi:hypothetical protein
LDLFRMSVSLLLTVSYQEKRMAGVGRHQQVG